MAANPSPPEAHSAQGDRPTANGGPEAEPLGRTLLQAAGLWILSDLGFYVMVMLPALGLTLSYNAGSVAATLYYVFWVGIAVITFWPLYARWPVHSPWPVFANRRASYLVWSAAFLGFILFAAYVLPLLPAPSAWTQPWGPPELRVATPSYFLPKSIEILFQQLLIVALVLALSDRRCSIRETSACCAAAFGAVHALLALGGMPIGYVIRFMVAATAFGLAFPFLILRVPNGLAYSYIVHWLYYAVTVAMVRLIAPPTP